MPTIRGAQRRDFETIMESLVRRTEDLPLPVMRKVGPVLAQAQKELEKELRAWKEKEDGNERFTTQKLRGALVQVRRAMETLKKVDPALVEGLRIGARNAGDLASELLEEEWAQFGATFDGSMQRISVDTAAMLAKGDQLVLKRFPSSARRYSGDLRKRLIQELAVGKVKGETIDQLTERLEKNIPHVFGQARRRAEMIARTETMNAYNTYHKAGIEEIAEDDDEIRMRWDASYDWRRCPQCSALDGKTVKPGKEFKAKWKTKRANGRTLSHSSTHETPPAHPNCRCVLVAWHKDWDLPDRRQEFGAKPPAPTKAAKPVKKAKPIKERRPPKPKTKPKRKKIDEQGLADDMKSQLKKDKWSRSDGRKSRGQMRQLVNGEFGLPNLPDTANQTMTVGRLPKGTLGTNDVIFNEVIVTKDQAKEAQRFAAKVASGAKSVTANEARGMSTLVHEQIHSTGPRMPFSAYVGQGMKIDEATTELATRRIMRKKYGKLQIVGAKTLGEDRRFAVDAFRGSYQSWIDDIAGELGETFGLSAKETDRLLDETAWRFRSSKRSLKDEGAIVRGFIDAIPRKVTREQRAKLLSFFKQ